MAEFLPTWLWLQLFCSLPRQLRGPAARTPEIAHSSCTAEPCPSGQTFPLHWAGHVLPVLGAARKSGHLV